jgi:CRP-like cAMP-binding protein
MTTVRDLRDIAEARLRGGDALGAIKVFRLVLEAAPLDFQTRLRIADSLLVLGETRLAGAVYTAAAVYDIKAGVPLMALVAVKMIQQVYPQVTGLQHDLAVLYCKDSPRIGRGARAAPLDLSARVRDDLDLDYSMDEAELKKTTAQMAAYTGNIEQFPPKVPPVPLFSELGASAFERVIHALDLRRLDDGEVVVKEGDPGDSFMVVARGTVRVFRHAADGRRVDLARLGEGSILGEMALIADEPRTASVDVEGSADLLVFRRKALTALADELPQVASVLQKFAQERMIRNVLATNPLFAPFEKDQRTNLLGRFEAHKISKGMVVVRQNEEGRGLYIVLQGAVEVTKKEADGSSIKLATLGPGECFGEISLVHERPTTASVSALRDSTILFLAREYFQRITQAVPELAEYYMELGVQRLLDTRRAVEEAARDAGEGEPVSDDELILL